MDINNDLLQKYDRPIPRYTSYPTYPHWEKNFKNDTFFSLVDNNVDIQTNPYISLYIHLPFCERLCHFCGCNKVITKNHQLEIPYLNSILKEWELYKKRLPKNIILKEMHLGGGTPTFFSAKNLSYFLKSLLKDFKIADDYDFSVEAHPGVTTKEHLDILKANGFNRLSLGVQDFNEEVQKIIGRVQTESDVHFCTEYARTIGFQSINYDLIYGLPLQTIQTIQETFSFVSKFKPDRIAFYSYAHLPALRPSQQKLDLNKRPVGMEKYEIYRVGYEILTQNGYVDLGYDHFALKTDSLYEAFLNQKLHRNFMGYTVQNTPNLIGLGVSAISDYNGFYFQNKKSIQEYMLAIAEDKLCYEVGYSLNKIDKVIKKHILNLSCYRKTSLTQEELPSDIMNRIFENLEPILQDKLVKVERGDIEVLPKGVPFLRNICACFDLNIENSLVKSNFSQSV
ncbi:oxygen-independent coproporphyrinogen III oxidase [Fluviispira multicolorata]|uniref:Coproporphyrinogen-III oxidase n=1 Tax=Fluviispira multicolorata TaxID=2654512 RepID=A0A833JCA1_9BACT|nr:oxygen-independent coproporphyrinogen III oxidase [Fluviispira multicolorata]KAB8030611.1 oxygen-independent coproporphyrinogen III oxidase [Fluviispira multicolorata]